MLAPFLLELGFESVTQVTACTPDAYVEGNWIDATLCPYMQTMGGGMFVITVAFFVIAGLFVFTRRVSLPAVVAIILFGMAAAVLPPLLQEVGGVFVIMVAAALLYITYKVFK